MINMKKAKLVPLIIGMSAMLLAGCGGSSSESYSSKGDNYDNGSVSYDSAEDSVADYDSAANYDSIEEAPNSSDEAGANQGGQIEDYSQKLIKTFYYSFETKNFDDSIDEITKRVKEFGGYVESSECEGSSDRDAHYTLRIPADRVDEFLNDTTAIGEIMRRSEEVEDISLSYYDTKTHIETLETQHKRLLELMESATKLEDIIQLESEISNIEYELNNYKTTSKVYDNKVNYATVHINVYEVSEISVTDEDSYWQKIGKGFMSGLSGVGSFFKGLFYVLVVCAPALVIIGLIVFFIIFFIRKSIKKKKAKALPPENVPNDTTNR